MSTADLIIETYPCKLRVLKYVFHFLYDVCELNLAVNTQLHKFYRTSLARVLYFVGL